MTGLSISGGVLTKVNPELSALKRRTGTAGSIGYIGGDVGSGLDCDAEYEMDDRRNKGIRYGLPDRRVDGQNNSSSSGGTVTGRNNNDIAYDNYNHNHSNSNSNRSMESQPYRHYQGSGGGGGDDDDGEEPELDIIRTPGPSSKSHRQPDSNNNSTSLTIGHRLPLSNNSSSNSTPAGSSKSRAIHSASVTRVRPPVSTTSSGVPLRRPSTTTSGKSAAPVRTTVTRTSFNGGSLPNSTRISGKDYESGDDNDNIGHAYRYDSTSSKSAGRLPSGSGVRTRCRSRSKEPTHKASPPIVKKDNFRQRDNSRERRDGNISTSPVEDEESEESKWMCIKCGHNNSNQFHCDHCSSKRMNYSFTPESMRLQRERQAPK